MHTTHSSFPSAYGNGLPLLYKVSSDSYIVNALSLRRLIYRLLLFFPVSSTFSSLSVCLSFYHLKTKHKTKSVHDSALFSSDFRHHSPFFSDKIIINNDSPNHLPLNHTVHFCSCYPTEICFDETPMTSLFLNPMNIFS